MGASLSTVAITAGLAVVITALGAAVLHLSGRLRSLKTQLSQEKLNRKLAEERAGEEERERRAAERRLAVARRRQPLGEGALAGMQAALAGLHNYVLDQQQQQQQQQQEQEEEEEEEEIVPEEEEHQQDQHAAAIQALQQITQMIQYFLG